jgi:hypothetical protein
MRRGRRGHNSDEQEEDAKGKVYLHLDGVRGTVWDGPYANCFLCGSVQYGQGRGIGGRGGGKREMSPASMSEMTLTLNNYDARVNVLHGLCTAGAVFPVV